jgi:hypothetical protein
VRRFRRVGISGRHERILLAPDRDSPEIDRNQNAKDGIEGVEGIRKTWNCRSSKPRFEERRQHRAASLQDRRTDRKSAARSGCQIHSPVTKLPHDRKYRGAKSHWFPVWNGILEHRERMGIAIYVFQWMIDKTTVEKGGKGIVLGGAPVKIGRIARDLRTTYRTIQRDIDHLEDENYIERVRTPYGFTFRVLNSCKFIGRSKKETGQKCPVSQGRDRTHVSGETGHFCPERPDTCVRNKEDITRKRTNNSAGDATLRSSAAAESSPNTQLDSETAAAFSSIGFDSPFGDLKFQEVFLRRFANRNGEWLTQIMEATIQECYRKEIGIPPQFYQAKHEIEEREQAEFENKFRKAPL